MKKTLNLIVCFLLLSVFAQAQCPVEAGLDIKFTCGDSVMLSVYPLGATDWALLHADPNGMGVQYNSVFFVTKNIGYISTGHNAECGRLLKTIDGGVNWIYPSCKTMMGFNCLNFTDSLTGYAVGYAGEIYKTSNGGKNWSAQVSGTSNVLFSIFFTDASTGYAVGTSGTIVKTINGGNTWTPKVSGTTNALKSVYFPSKTTGYAVGYSGTALKTTNAGATWTPLSTGISTDLNTVYFTDTLTGFIGGNEISKTTDGGVTWNIKYPKNLDVFKSIYFVNSDTGYAVIGTNVFKTTNKGNNWNLSPNNVTGGGALNSIFFLNGNTGFAVGGNETVIKYTPDTAGYTYNWSPSTGLSATNVAHPKASPATEVIYKATVTKVYGGCSDIDSVKVTPQALSISILQKNITMDCGDSVILNTQTNYIGNKLLYTWSPSAGLNKTNIANPTAKPADTTMYHILTSVNGCTAKDSVTIKVKPLIIYGDSIPLTCGDSVLLSTTINYKGKDKLTYSWLPTTGLNNPNIASPKASVSSSQSYNFSVSSTVGCKSKAKFDVYLIPMNTPSICLVTVDPPTIKNLVVWERPKSNFIKRYNIFKESTQAGKYDSIGFQPYDSLSVFLDINSNPTTKSDRYKLSLVDICNIESPKSTAHMTINLQASKGTSGEKNLSWNSYEGLTFPSYKIYRGTTPTNLQLLATIASSYNAYTDTSKVAGLFFYQISMIKGDTCFPAIKRAQTSSGPYSQSVSNLKDFSTAATQYLTADPAKLNLGAAAGSTANINVFTNLTTWNAVSSDPSWLDIVKNVAAGSIKVTATSASSKRTGYVTIKGIGVDSVVIEVNQGTVGIEGNIDPNDLAIFPNPYSGYTNITYNLTNAGNVRLEVYNIVGKKTTELYSGYQNAGYYTYHFNSSNVGKSDGIYFVLFNLDKKIVVKKIVELK